MTVKLCSSTLSMTLRFHSCRALDSKPCVRSNLLCIRGDDRKACPFAYRFGTWKTGNGQGPIHSDQVVQALSVGFNHLGTPNPLHGHPIHRWPYTSFIPQTPLKFIKTKPTSDLQSARAGSHAVTSTLRPSIPVWMAWTSPPPSITVWRTYVRLSPPFVCFTLSCCP